VAAAGASPIPGDSVVTSATADAGRLWQCRLAAALPSAETAALAGTVHEGRGVMAATSVRSAAFAGTDEHMDSRTDTANEFTTAFFRFRIDVRPILLCIVCHVVVNNA
jgi:hypothetical protein